jgi:hypothetical protein
MPLVKRVMPANCQPSKTCLTMTLFTSVLRDNTSFANPCPNSRSEFAVQNMVHRFSFNDNVQELCLQFWRCYTVLPMPSTGSLAVCALVLSAPALLAAERPKVWTFDRLDKIGGLRTTVVGHPLVIKTPLGNAVQFNGVDDAIFLPEHPLAGADTFTFEAIFRPERGGAAEQRWFHLAEQDPKTGADTDTRFLFEIRVLGDQWCLDAFVHTPTANQALLYRNLLHPLDVWHQVAMVYDGKEFTSYVNGVLQGKAAIHFEPEGPGHSSVGVRINKQFYFKGSVRQARFTRRALSPAEFLKVPSL